MGTTQATYSVNGEGFDSFTAAIKAAQPLRAVVIEVATGLVRWRPAAPAAKRTRHVLVNVDGSKTEFSKVRR
jgi:hypothetical protein